MHRIARERVREPVAAGADLFHEPFCRSLLEEREERVVVDAGHSRQRRDVERFTEHRGSGQHLGARRREALDARADEIADPFGYVAERRTRPVGDVTRELADVERVAAGAVVDGAGLRSGSARLERAADQRSDVGELEPPELDPIHLAVTTKV